MAIIKKGKDITHRYHEFQRRCIPSRYHYQQMV